MKLINLYGGPGTGKSTTAAQIFAELKKRQFNAELVTEFAKDLTWHERQKTLTDQFYIAGKQHHKIFMLQDQVDYIVTDSPILLGLYYNQLSPNPMPQSFNTLLLDLWAKYDSIDILLKRSKPYNPKGRNQTEEEAREIDEALERLLYDNCITHVNYGTNPEDIELIVELITNG